MGFCCGVLMRYLVIHTNWTGPGANITVEMKLTSFIRYQRYMGLTDIDYSDVRKCYVLNGNWKSYSSQVVIQIILTAGFIEALLRTGFIYMDMRSRSVNLFHYLVILFIPITQLLVSIWIRLQQKTQVILLNKLTQFTDRLQVNTEKMSRPRWLYCLWMVTSLYYTCMIIAHSLLVWNLRRNWSYLLAFLSFFVLLVRSNFLITLYTCLVHVVMGLLQVQADLLKITPRTLAELSNNLCLYDDLLLLCHQELVQVFSGAFIMIFSFYLLDATCLSYVTTITERFSVLKVLQTFSWLIPLIIYLIMPLMVNDLKRQVSKKMKQYIYISSSIYSLNFLN